MSKRSILITLLGTLACLSASIIALARAHPAGQPQSPIVPTAFSQAELTVDLQQRLEALRVEDSRIIVPAEGGPRRLTPDEFAQALQASQREANRRPLLMRAANVRSLGGLAWVAFGVLGQLIFMGRMLVQWLVSERSGRSVVPVAFWWMSLCGGTMVLIYFIWRHDPVGILGQMMGWLIYLRNLWLIYRGRGASSSDLPLDPAIG